MPNTNRKKVASKAKPIPAYSDLAYTALQSLVAASGASLRTEFINSYGKDVLKVLQSRSVVQKVHNWNAPLRVELTRKGYTVIAELLLRDVGDFSLHTDADIARRSYSGAMTVARPTT